MTTAPAHPVNPKTILLVASGATFVAFLDTTVVNVAFSKILASFPTVSLATMTWLVTSYAVLFAALLALAGRMADVTGRRRLFVVSVAVFTAASLLAMAAPTFEVLLTARAIQGIAAAGMIPAALGLILFNTPAEHRTAAIGVWGASGSLAAALGPALSAWLTDLINWRAIFAINVPFGLLMIWGTYRAAPADAPTGRPLPDPVGTAAFTVGVAGVVLGLSEGSNWHWASASVLALLVGGGIFTAWAILRSWGRQEGRRSPALELDLYQNRRFALAGLGSTFFGAALYTWLLVSPLFLSVFWHYSILKVGLAITPGAFTAAVASVVVGKRFTAKAQGTAVLVGGLLFAAVCAFMGFALGHHPSFLAIWLPAGVFGGAAIGLALTGLTTISSTSVPPQRFSSGTGLTLTARQLGGALGIAIMAALLTGGGDTLLHHFLTVYRFCTVASIAAAGVGVALGLGLRQVPVRADAAVSESSA